MKPRLFVLAALCLSIACLSTKAQEQQGSVYTVSTYKVPFESLTQYFEFVEKEYKPRAAQNEFILSQKYFTHLWGPDWTVLVITEYKDLASIQAAQKRSSEILEKQYPDKVKRDEMSNRGLSLFQAHTDAIVVENPKVRK